MLLTQKDLDEIEQIVGRKVKEDIRNLPTKDEFFKAMDELMGEVKTSREEQTILAHQSADHEQRITKLEKKTFVSSAPTN